MPSCRSSLANAAASSAPISSRASAASHCASATRLSARLWPWTVSGADAAISPAIASALPARRRRALHDPERDRLVDVDDRPASRKSRAPLPDEQREPPDVARAEVHAEPSDRDREPRAGPGDAQVARDRELHARAHRRAVDRRDHRRRMGDDRVEHAPRTRAERVDRAVGGRFGRRETGHEVGARAERRAGTGDHDRAQVGAARRDDRGAPCRAHR